MEISIVFQKYNSDLETPSISWDNRHFSCHNKVESCSLFNWVKYTRKKIKAGIFPAGQRLLFESIEVGRSNKQLEGRKCKHGQGQPISNNLHQTIWSLRESFLAPN